MPLTLLLIRHCESVGNVQCLYSGHTDHPPTSHGISQTLRLGQHVTGKMGLHFAKIFASDLQRAYRTAGAIAEAQGDGIEVERDERIREQYFGYLECVRWDVTSIDKGVGTDEEKANPVETYESMVSRADEWIAEKLVPELNKLASEGAHNTGNVAVAIVAHGSFNRVLWKRIIHVLGKVQMDPETLGEQGPDAYTRQVHWRNTGFLEVVLEPKEGGKMGSDLKDWVATVKRVDCGDHLEGLKRTGSGIGSAPADDKQTKLDKFLKK